MILNFTVASYRQGTDVRHVSNNIMSSTQSSLGLHQLQKDARQVTYTFAHTSRGERKREIDMGNLSSEIATQVSYIRLHWPHKLYMMI